MTPAYADDWLTVYGGDCRTVLATLPAESVHCVVTSPPFWGLRDYGHADQLGLEPTPEEYVANMVAVFREVRRVLRRDGTLWLNLGDSYAGGGNYRGNSELSDKQRSNRGSHGGVGALPVTDGLKPKDLVGIPWRVAFALQADGWYLRSDIIWAKPNPMPESVTDRPTKSHEYLFLFAKSERYYFDADAVREAGSPNTITAPKPFGRKAMLNGSGTGNMAEGVLYETPSNRNIRSVWTIPTQPYPGAHFAVFPPKLVEPCIKAGTSERGVCAECGAPWRRVTSVVGYDRQRWAPGEDQYHTQSKGKHGATSSFTTGDVAIKETTDWRASCDHVAECPLCDGRGWTIAADPLPSGEPGEPYQRQCAHDAATVPATVLDPFAGSGTTGLVAQRLSRRALLIDLNPDYLAQQLERNAALPLGLVG